MGILKPDAPKLPPAPVYEPIKEDNSEELQKELARKRGLAGTINTSWQGLLDKNENSIKRKTLLGE